MVQRDIHKKLKYLLSKFPIVSLTGPRQSGKSTFLKAAYPKYTYLSLEDIDNREFARKDPRGFLQQYNNKVILDEVQQVPELFSYLQTHVDANNRPGQYILSGSQNFLLLKNITQSLAGRVAMLRLLPFSFNELKIGKWFVEHNNTLIYKGFYPKVFDKKIKPLDFYSSYVETYIQRDVRSLLNIGNLKQFTSFLQLCAGRVGQILNLNALANDVGITQPTARAWLSTLEASYILYTLSPYYNNFNKRIIKSPKLYFYDTGLAAYLLGIRDVQQVQIHFAKGALFENLIITELLKIVYNKGELPNFYYWRDSNDNEIDLLIEEANKIKTVEIKSSSTFNTSFLKGAEYFKNIKIKKMLRSFVILGLYDIKKRNNITILGPNNLEKLI